MTQTGEQQAADNNVPRSASWLKGLAIVALAFIGWLDYSSAEWEAPVLLYAFIAMTPAGIHAEEIVDRVAKQVSKYITSR